MPEVEKVRRALFGYPDGAVVWYWVPVGQERLITAMAEEYAKTDMDDPREREDMLAWLEEWSEHLAGCDPRRVPPRYRVVEYELTDKGRFRDSMLDWVRGLPPSKPPVVMDSGTFTPKEIL